MYIINTMGACQVLMQISKLVMLFMKRSVLVKSHSSNGVLLVKVFVIMLDIVRVCVSVILGL